MKNKFVIWMSIFLSLTLAGLSSTWRVEREETKPAVEEVRAEQAQYRYTGPTTNVDRQLEVAIEKGQGALYLQAVHQAEMEKKASAARSSTQARAPTESLVSLQPCGGDLPPCYVKARESGGNYNAYNPTGCDGRGCFGAWQFSGAWACKLGLPCDLSTATPQQQDDAARQLWNGGRGCQNWNAC